MRIGYGRVSTDGQIVDTQRSALEAAGCQRIFLETASGRRRDRPELAAALGLLRAGDEFVVCRLDRLGRSVSHLVEVVGQLRETGVAFVSLHEGFDTSTAVGRVIFHVFAAIAEFERDLIEERTEETLAAKRAKGVHLGRPRSVTPDVLAAAVTLLDTGEYSVREVAAKLGVGRSTLYERLAEVGR